VRADAVKLAVNRGAAAGASPVTSPIRNETAPGWGSAVTTRYGVAAESEP